MLAASAACRGSDGKRNEPQTVEVTMVDTAFQPSDLAVTAGVPVVFRFVNSGKATHEAFVGTAAEQRAHGETMRDPAHGGHGTDTSDAVTIAPGAKDEIRYTFKRRGSYEIGCHQPGHYEAGMKLTVTAR